MALRPYAIRKRPVLTAAKRGEVMAESLGSDARQARPDHGGRQQPLDRLGHRHGLPRAGRRSRLHLSGRRAEEARRAAGRGGRRAGGRPLRRHRSGDASTRCSPPCSRPGARSISCVHAIAFSDKDQLDGRYVDTTEDNFTKTMLICCYSFTAIAQRAEKLMTERRLDADADLLRRREMDAALQRHGRRQGGAGMLGALSRGRSRREEHPRQRHLRRARSRRWPPPASATSATS